MERSRRRMLQTPSTRLLSILLILSSCLFSIHAHTWQHGSPVIWKENIAVGLNSQLATLQIQPNADEPVDTLERFRHDHRLSREWRQQKLKQICAQSSIQCRRDAPIVFSSPIQSAHGHLGQLQILEGEEAADAVHKFATQHSLPYEEKQQIINSVCTNLNVLCTRKKVVLYDQYLHDESGNDLGLLQIFDDTEPVDQIYRFIVDQDLPKFVRHQLQDRVCKQVLCQRKTPMVYSNAITDQNQRHLGLLQIRPDDEPADVIYGFGLQVGLSKAQRQQLTITVCNDKYVTCDRHRPYVLVSPIMLENGTELGILRMQEDEELADSIHRLAQEVEVEDSVRDNLFQTLCPRPEILCTRAQALLKSVPVANSAGVNLGKIDIFDGLEPADTVYAFAALHELSEFERESLLDSICNSISCTRYAPIRTTITVGGQDGDPLGKLEILVNEEPADAVARFGTRHGLSSEEKENLVTSLCDREEYTCTRTKGLIYQAVYTLPEGKRERLDFLDESEPTDVIYEYGLLRNLSFGERKAFLYQVCNEPRGRPNCTRAEPMLLKIPMWESAEKKIGDVEILEGQEPVDMVYAFLEKHDLFQTEPVNTTLLSTVCNSTRVECKRQKPRRILFSMHATYRGIPHTLTYLQPESDWVCTNHPDGGQRCEHYVEHFSEEFCATHMSDWAQCRSTILDALRNQLEIYEHHVWFGKNLYAKLGLVNWATSEEIDSAYNRLVKRYNNETETRKYEKLQDAYRVLSDPEEKYFYDLPCIKLFGLCGKKQKDGGITISAD